MAAKQVPLDAAAVATAPLTGLFIITEDAMGVASYLCQWLGQRGAMAVVVSSSVLADQQLLANFITQMQSRTDQIVGLIHLAGLAAMPLPDSLSTWHRWSQQQVTALLQLLQGFADDLQQHGQILAASLLGGAFGRQSACGPGLPLAGGSSGLLRTLLLEWPALRAKMVDFSAESTPQTIAEQIGNELVSPDQDFEIGYQQQRMVFQLMRAELAPTARSTTQPDPSWVIICIGGARGITAEITAALLQPGMTLVLVGRSALDWAEPTVTQCVDQPQELRQILIRAAQQSGRRMTPAQIEAEVQKIQHHRAMQQNLARFKKLGAIVDYQALDVTDEQALSTFLAQVYEQYGRIDGVIQGAGVLDDKLILNKTLDSFNRVFRTKVDSTFLLCRYLRPDTLKLMILFASVAGRTGNRGQGDYAAANEVLNRLAWWMRVHWPHTRVLSINWGPWEGTGMASEAINRQFRSRGVIPIPVAAGQAFLMQELQYGNADMVELITGFYQQEDLGVAMQPATNQTALSPVSAAQRSLPLVINPIQVISDGTVIYEHEISLQTHPYLQDHQINQTPVLAAAAALELMAEHVQATWPDWIVVAIKDLKVMRGITLKMDPQQRINIHLYSPVQHGDNEIAVQATLAHPTQSFLFYQAQVILAQSFPASTHNIMTALETAAPLDVQDAYQRYCFHGDRFRILTAISGLNAQGVDAAMVTTNPQDWLLLDTVGATKTWLFDPGIVDAALQLGLIWVGIQDDTAGLPARFGNIVRYGQLTPNQPLRIQLRTRRFEPSIFIFDAVFLNSANQVVLVFNDIQNTVSKAIRRFITDA